MRELILNLDTALNQNRSQINRLIIDEFEIDAKDENTIHKLFYKNNIQHKAEAMTIDQIGQICVFSLQKKNKYISSWCVHYLLDKIAYLKLNEDDNLIEQQTVWNSPYTVLLLWHINQIFNLKGSWPPGKEIHWFSQSVNPFNVSFYYLTSKLAEIFNVKRKCPIEEFYRIFLTFAAQIDTYRVAKNTSFYEAYETKILKNIQLPSAKKQSKFAQYEVVWAEAPDPTAFLLRQLVGYVQSPNMLYSSYKDSFFRFLDGRWNQHHVDTVRASVRPFWLGTVPAFEGCNCEYYLQGLRSNLLAAKKPVNPSGTLAQIINFTQLKIGRIVIDIDELNEAIAKKKQEKAMYLDSSETSLDCSILCTK
ncbi:MAG TPA: hypothetical protein PK657_10420 [Legionella sp.]|nr:hypothetical protein [Legionella sp.]